MKTIAGAFYQFDTVLFYRIFRCYGNKFANDCLTLISRSGDGFLYPVVALIILLINPLTGKNLILSGLVSYTIELSLYKIIKQKVKRHRPFEKLEKIEYLIAPPDRFSFPSGHTAAAFLFAILISFVYPSFLIPLFIWEFSVGFSRIYLGVHFPTDVIAGMILGIFSGYAGLVIIF